MKSSLRSGRAGFRHHQHVRVNELRRQAVSIRGRSPSRKFSFHGEGANLDDIADFQKVPFDTHSIGPGENRTFHGPPLNLPVLSPFLYRNHGARLRRDAPAAWECAPSLALRDPALRGATRAAA
jgi:hypothetical protein